MSDSTETENPYRLPRHVVPVHYELVYEVDLAASRFDGRATVAVHVNDATDTIVLNAVELELAGAHVTVGERRIDVAVSADPTLERVSFALGETLPANSSAELHVTFGAKLNEQLAGFYRSSFTDGDGVEHTIACTQFEATDARRAFPCFDEPDLKATFGVTLIVPAGAAAVSNGPDIAHETLPDGRTRFTFDRTMAMSTYLVAFVVGPLVATDAVDVDGVPLRIVHVAGKEHLTPFALEVGAFALRHFVEYYGIAYPAAKLDLVALPDFASGAMENLGCVTFREALLLVDPATSTQTELSRVADVIAHEIAHMWFGDLVTMRWWNGLWLNEAFATFMEVMACDAFRPAWDRWTSFGLERSAAFDVDALAATRPIEYPVISPEDAEGMFDVLTYEKGGSVLRMLEQYLGAEAYREGIGVYLRTHAYANTDTVDLWDAIESASGEPVRRIMDTWILQGGFPLVRAELDASGTLVTLSQQRFRYRDGDDGTRWLIPLLVRDGAGEAEKILLGDDDVELTVGAAPVVVNAGGHGFYRTRYDAALRARLADNLDELEPIERYQLLDDTWAAVVAGEAAAADWLGLAARFADETHLGVWRALAGGFGALHAIAPDDAAAERIAAAVRSVTADALASAGWSPADGESELDRERRGVILGLAGTVGADPAVQDAARALLADDAAYAAADATVAAAAVRIVATVGGAAEWAMFAERSRTAPTPQEQLRYLYALAEFGGVDEFDATLAYALSGQVRTQNAPFLLASTLQNRRHGRRAFDAICAHWDDLLVRFPSNTIVRMLAGVRALSKPEDAAAVRAFFEGPDAHQVPQGARTLEQHLEKLAINEALRTREAPTL